MMHCVSPSMVKTVMSVERCQCKITLKSSGYKVYVVYLFTLFQVLGLGRLYSLHYIQNLFKIIFKFWQVITDNLPNNVHINSEIMMCNYVA